MNNNSTSAKINVAKFDQVFEHMAKSIEGKKPSLATKIASQVLTEQIMKQEERPQSTHNKNIAAAGKQKSFLSDTDLKKAITGTLEEPAKEESRVIEIQRADSSCSSSSGSAGSKLGKSKPKSNKSKKSQGGGGENRSQSQEAPIKIIELPFDMRRITRLENTKMSRVMTHELVSEVTKSINEVNFGQFENRIKEIILKIVEKPIRRMALNEELFVKYAQSTRQNVRRVHELEYVMQKFHKVAAIAENLEQQYIKSEQAMKTQSIRIEDEIKDIKRQLKEDVPDMMDWHRTELESWKRWFVRIQNEFNDIKQSTQNDIQESTTVLRQHMSATTRNLGQLHKNQLNLDTDGQLLKNKMQDLTETVCDLDCKIDVQRHEYERHRNDFDVKIEKLTQRIEKAEADRMEKYYKQVSELQEWITQAKPKLADSFKMVESLASHYGAMDNQAIIINLIAEVMSNTLEGRQMNNLIDYIQMRQDTIGQRRLGQINNSFQDKLIITTSYLKQKKPFFQMPNRINDEDLPPDFNQIIADLTKQMESMQKQEREKMEIDRKNRRNRAQKSHQSLSDKSQSQTTTTINVEQTQQQTFKHSKTIRASSPFKSQKNMLLKEKQIAHGEQQKKDVQGQIIPPLQKKPTMIKVGKLGRLAENTTQKTDKQQPGSGQKASFEQKGKEGAKQMRTNQPMLRPANTLSPQLDKKAFEEQKNVKVNSFLQRQTTQKESSPQKKFTAMDKMVGNLKSRVKDELLPVSAPVPAPVPVPVSAPVPAPVPVPVPTEDYNQKLSKPEATDARKISVQVSDPDDKPIGEKLEWSSGRDLLLNSNNQQQNKQLLQAIDVKKQLSTISSPSGPTTKQEDTSFIRSVNIGSPMLSERSSDISARCSNKSRVSQIKIQTCKKKGTIGFVVKTKQHNNQHASSSDSDEDSFELDSDYSGSSDDGKGGSDGFGHKSKKYVSKLLNKKRQLWAGEDDQKYAQLDQFTITKQKLDDADLQLLGMNKLFREHEKLNDQQNKELKLSLVSHDERMQDLQKQINLSEASRIKDKADTQARQEAIEIRFNENMDKQFNDFVKKIDGELTRRNRFKIEAEQKFAKTEELLGELKAEIGLFRQNQGKVLGTVQKFMYMCDIQSSLNIQDELDREWVSLFSGLVHNTGQQSVGAENGLDNKTIFTLNKDCMSCTGNMEKNLNLFKVACLNYSSNPVEYQGKRVDRRELITLQKVISDMAKAKLDPSRLKEELQSQQQQQLSLQLPSHMPSESPSQLNGGDTSPERTTIQSIGTHLNQDLPISVDAISTTGPPQQSTQPLQMTQPTFSQLSKAGIQLGRCLIDVLEFKDNDLQEFAKVKDMHEKVYAANFRTSRAAIRSKRSTSAYKRKTFNTTYVGSTMGHLSTSILAQHSTIQNNIEQSDAIIDNLKPQYASQMISNRGMITDSRQRSSRLELLPTAVIEVGSQTFHGVSVVGDTTGSSYQGGNRVIHNQPPTSQMLFLKSRQHLQPIASQKKAVRKGYTTSHTRFSSVASKDGSGGGGTNMQQIRTQRSTSRGQQRPTSTRMIATSRATQNATNSASQAAANSNSSMNEHRLPIRVKTKASIVIPQTGAQGELNMHTSIVNNNNESAASSSHQTSESEPIQRQRHTHRKSAAVNQASASYKLDLVAAAKANEEIVIGVNRIMHTENAEEGDAMGNDGGVQEQSREQQQQQQFVTTEVDEKQQVAEEETGISNIRLEENDNQNDER